MDLLAGEIERVPCCREYRPEGEIARDLNSKSRHEYRLSKNSTRGALGIPKNSPFAAVVIISNFPAGAIIEFE